MTDERKTSGKRYGLVCPKKAALAAPKSTNVFGDEDDSEGDDSTDWVKKALKAEGERNRAKRQNRLNIEKALEEDPTICQYDEVFDDMKSAETRAKDEKKSVKKAKYIDNLLKTAERRKREQEHRIERMVQKEREAEGAEFADKESFVTSAYRAKLEEFKKMEDEEERMDRLEAIGDVTKQRDMSGFYRHLYRQASGVEKTDFDGPKAGISNAENTKESPKISEKNIDEDDPVESSSSSEESPRDSKKWKKSQKSSEKSKRRYRSRVVESSSSESEEEEKAAPIAEDVEVEPQKSRIQEEIPSREERIEPVEKKAKLSDKQEERPDRKKDKIRVDMTKERSRSPSPKADPPSASPKENPEKIPSDDEEKKKKPSIWEKRTVGDIFDAAQQRYYTRKAMRLSGS